MRSSPGKPSAVLDPGAPDAERAASSYARNLIEASLDPLVTISPSGTITDVNEATVAVTGVAREVLIGTDFCTYFTEPEQARAGYRRVFAEGSVKDYPLTIRHRDGHLTEVLYNATVYRDERGAVIGVFAAARDVTELRRAEASTARQAERYAAIMATTPDGFCLCGLDGRLLDVNQAYCDMSGYSREELLARSIPDLEGAETAAETARHVRRISEQGFDRFETRHRRKDGSAFDVEVSASVAPGAGSMVVFIRDITQKKHGQRELLRLARALRTLNRCNEALVRATGEQALLEEICRILVDSGGYRLSWVGWAAADPERRVVAAAWAGEGADYVQSVDARWDESERGSGPTGRCIRERRAIAQRNIPTDPAFALWRERAMAHGYVASVAAPLVRGDAVLGALMVYSADPEAFDGEEVALITELANDLAFGVGALRDRAERIRAMDALAAERRRLESVLEGLPVYAVLLSRDYHVPFANRFFRERFGESHGRRCYEYLFGRSEPCTICESFVPFTTHRPHQWEWTGPDGRQYAIHDEPFADVDGTELVLEMGIDVTEQKRAEQRMRQINVELEQRVADRTAQLEAANRELEAFSYSVSHDLRAPLRSMSGFSQALVEDYGPRLDERGRDFVNRVQAATRRMGQLIDDLLTLSRVSRTEMRREEIDVSRLARTVAEGLAQEAPGRRVEWVIPDGLTACADAALVRLALENLLGNAWKFTGKHAQARIAVGWAVTGRGPAFFVQDDGAGFDPAYADKLFGAFQRLHGSAEFEGTGIGLATVQRIVHRHGGEVWADSAVERGATFYFTLEP